MNKKRSFQSFQHISRHDDRIMQFSTDANNSSKDANLWNHNLDPVVSTSNDNSITFNKLHGHTVKLIQFTNCEASSYFPEEFITNLDKEGHFLTYNNDILYAIQCHPLQLSVGVCHPNHLQAEIIPKSSGNELQKNGDLIWTPSLRHRIYFKFIPNPQKKISGENYTVWFHL